MTPATINAAKPAMLSRRTAAHVLAIHSATATPERPRPYPIGWVLALLVAGVVIVAVYGVPA